MKDSSHKRLWIKTVLIGISAILISMIRRPNQINYPEVWVEEGTQFLPHFLERGWLFLFEPVNGYLIIPSKLISLIAYHISFVHYPAISYALALLVSGIVAMVIYRAPTHLRFPALAALVPFLVPFDPEPIGIGEYAFWFVGLFSILGLIWKGEERTRLRMALTAIGGLSAPLGISILPLFVVRALWTRSRSDLLTTGVATATTALQLWFVVTTGASSTSYVSALLENPYDNFLIFITKFISEFFWAREPSTLLGIAVVFVAIAYLWRDLREERYVALTLLICAAISAVLSIIRVPLEAIDPMGNGPRYFFYPYIFIAWAMLAFSAAADRRKALSAAGVLVLLNTGTFLDRPHDDLDWAGAVDQCLNSPEGADLPVHQNGIGGMAWKVTLTQAQCQKMERISLF